MHALDAIHLSNAITSVGFLALGAWVLSASRRATNVAFATYAFAWATTVLTANLVLEVGHPDLDAALVNMASGALTTAALVALVLRYPFAVDRNDVLPVLAGLATAVGATVWGPELTEIRAFFTPRMGSVVAFGIHALNAGLLGVLVFLALRWRRAAASDRRSIALVSAALVLWSAYVAGDALLDGELAYGFVILLLAALWSWNTASGGGRSARAVAWLGLGAMLVAMVENVLLPGAPDLWGYGVTRLVGVAILGYAIVRHQLLGIDVKVRWTLSRSTVAATFIAVFFIVSEAAQQYFGDAWNSTYLGIAAAGMLVFAIAPLHRIAESLAERAVPVRHGAAHAPRAGPSAAEAFRSAVRVARHDGEVTPAEARHLADVADALGLSNAEAAALRNEVERESAAAFDPPA